MSQPSKLTPELQRYAEEQVNSGNFSSVEEVTRAAFALLRENAERATAVRAELGALFDEMDVGKAIATTDEEFARMVRATASKYSSQ
jgi:putative addiction module CopG family antidote